MERKLKYRKEIDGLRAVAVVPVVLFHADIAGFGGGFVGVDIFFVISGFLITSVIVSELQSDNFSIVNFYERRARRILPALCFLVLVTSFFAFILMPANYLKAYSESVVSVMTFTSNVFFYLTSGYFSTAADEKPLLHTWSLAVEEQYYIFYPVLLAFLWNSWRKYIIHVLLILSILSLITAQALVMAGLEDFNFYLIFSRCWELFFGAITAFLYMRKLPNDSSNFEQSLTYIGVLLLVISIIVFSERTPFPSLYTLFPVLGTSLILYFSNDKFGIGKFLSLRPIVFVGLTSYSFYLWHQPLLASLRLKTIGEPLTNQFLMAIALAFAISVFSLYFIERPFRNRSKYSQKQIFSISAFALGVFATLGLVGYGFEGFQQRFPQSQLYSDSIQFSPRREECHTIGADYLPVSEACQYFRESPNWAIFGDSHVVEPGYALARKLEKHNEGVLHLSFSECPPSLLFEVEMPGCTKWFREALAQIIENQQIENVFLGFRYTSFLFGHQEDSYPSIPDIAPGYLLTQEYRDLSVDVRELYWESLVEVINKLISTNKKVILLYPIPELPIHIELAVMPFSIFGERTSLNLDEATSVEYFFDRNRFILNKLDSLEYGENLIAIKPFDLICGELFCPAVKDGAALYFDDDHLSLSGADLVADEILRTLNY